MRNGVALASITATSTSTKVSAIKVWYGNEGREGEGEGAKNSRNFCFHFIMAFLS